MGTFGVNASASLSAGISIGVGSNNSPNAIPFTSFNFVVEIRVEGVSDMVCGGAFSECEGIEMSIEPKTIREGGRNSGPVHLVGAVSYGQLSLKRGMTPNFDLWKWFEKVSTATGAGTRATAEIAVMSSDGASEVARFVASGCLPVKLRATGLNAKEGQLLIEEMSLAYENLSLQSPGGGGLELDLSISAGISGGLSASVSGGISGSLSAAASASADVSIGGSLTGSLGGSAGF